MKEFVLKRKFINYCLLYLLTCGLFGIFVATFVLTLLKQIEMVIIPIFLGILFILMLLGLIDVIRTRIIIKDKELIIKKNIFKTIIINVNSLSEVAISLFFNNQKKSIVRRIIFYDKKNEIITKINNFEIEDLNNFEEFINYLEQFNIPLRRKVENVNLDIKKNMILIISASIVTLILFSIILIFLDLTYNNYKKTKYSELLYINDKIAKIETNDNINIYFNDNEYYVILDSLDLKKSIHVDDNLKIYYKNINNKNIIFELYDNDILYYSYDDFISKAISTQNNFRIIYGIIILIEAIVPFIFYFVLTKSEKRKQNYYKALDSKYKIDIEGIIKYKLTNFKETIKYKHQLENHMLSKIVLDGISYFIIEYDNRKDLADYYIGYSYCGKKALIDAFIEDDKIYLDDDLNFTTNSGTTEFLDIEKKIFESSFDEIEKITKHKPIYMSQYEEIDENKDISEI